MTAGVVKMMKRDVALLVDIYKHRYLTISQVQRLHFPSLQTAYRRTKVLKRDGCISGFNVANIDEGIFSLTAKGLEVVAGALGVDRNDLKWNEAKEKPKDYYFMRHFLAINDFRIAVRQACEKSPVRLVGFIPDYYGEKTEKGGVMKYIKDVICDVANEREQVSHTPDGVFALEKDGRAALFFLEIDRGTEVVADPRKGVLKCLRFYASYLVDGKYQRYARDFAVEGFKGFRTLIVTSTQARLLSIRRASTEMDVPPKAKRFLWVTTEDKITPDIVFTPIWKSIDSEDNTTYRIG